MSERVVRVPGDALFMVEEGDGPAVVIDPPAAARLPDLRCPVLAVAGHLDVSDVVETARHLEERAPNARATILPDVAHMIGMECPPELAVLIAEFPAPLRSWT